MTNTIDQILNHPLHRSLGLELIALDDQRARTRFRIDDGNASISQGLHGGVLYLLADVTAALIAFAKIGADELAVSHSVQFALMKSVTLGDVVELEARIEKLGRNLIFISVTAFGPSNSPDDKIATGSVIKSRIARKRT